jgi:hypothetical protein
MSVTAIRAALEAQLATITPALSTAYENVSFSPVTGTAYQACYTLRATPDNPTMGDGFYRELGIFQVSLFYPAQNGSGAAETRAGLIREAFKRGISMISGSTTVRVARTPEIGAGRIDGDRWHVPVKIQWFADITT